MAVDTNTTVQSGNGDANTIICMAVAAAATGLALAQAVGAAGNLNLTGALIVAGAYTGTGARRMVAVSTDAGDTTQTATFTGTDRYGRTLVEVVALNGVTPVITTQDFLTVTRVAISAATAGNISAGTSAIASGAWVAIERFRNNPVSIAVIGQLVSGAVTWTLEHTYDDVNTPALEGTFQVPVPFPKKTDNPGLFNVGDSSPPLAWADATLAAKAATTEGSMALPYAAYRFTVNTGTGVFKGQARVAAMASGRH